MLRAVWLWPPEPHVLTSRLTTQSGQHGGESYAFLKIILLTIAA